MFKAHTITNGSELKSIVFDLDWTPKSRRIVVNVAREQKFAAFLGTDKNVMCSKDAREKGPSCENMYFVKEFVTTANIDKQFIDRVASIKFVQGLIDEAGRVSYYKELYFLKRKSFATFEEYQRGRTIKNLSEK